MAKEAVIERKNGDDEHLYHPFISGGTGRRRERGRNLIFAGDGGLETAKRLYIAFMIIKSLEFFIMRKIKFSD